MERVCTRGRGALEGPEYVAGDGSWSSERGDGEVPTEQRLGLPDLWRAHPFGGAKRAKAMVQIVFLFVSGVGSMAKFAVWVLH